MVFLPISAEAMRKMHIPHELYYVSVYSLEIRVFFLAERSGIIFVGKLCEICDK